MGFDRMDAEAMETLLLNELQMSSRETDQSIEYYDKLISTCEEDHSRWGMFLVSFSDCCRSTAI